MEPTGPDDTRRNGNGSDSFPAGVEASARTMRVLASVRLVFMGLFAAGLMLLFAWMIVGSLLTDGQPPPRHRLERVEGRLSARKYWHEPFYRHLPSQYVDTYELHLAGQPGRYEIGHAQFPAFHRAAFEHEVPLGTPVALLVEPGERTAEVPVDAPRAGTHYRAVFGVEAGGTVYLYAGRVAREHSGPIWLGPNGRLTRAAISVGLAGLFVWGLVRARRRRRRGLTRPPRLRQGARWR